MLQNFFKQVSDKKIEDLFFYLGRDVLHPLDNLFTFFLNVFDSILDNLELSSSSRQRYASVPPHLLSY